MSYVAIVIPVYKKELNEDEEYSLGRVNEVLGRYPVIFVAPESLKRTGYQKLIPSAKWHHFADECFTGFSAYNKLLMSDEFYAVFSEYEKMLICQTDVLVLEDRLQEFLTLPYDYIGAPIAIFRNDLYQLYGGNGGFSLRDVKACRRMIKIGKDKLIFWRDNEDEFFSHMGLEYPDMFRVAPVDIASKFAFDRFSYFLYNYNNNELPFAIHAWYNHDLSSLSEKILAKINGNKMPAQKIWGSNDLAELLEFIKKNQSILFYGAGEWGKCFLQYCQYHDIKVDGFIVSDNQLLAEDEYRGVPIWPLSKVPGGVSHHGVVLTVGRMLRDKIKENLRSYGVDSVAEISEVIWDEVGTFLLEQENKTGKAIYGV